MSVHSVKIDQLAVADFRSDNMRGDVRFWRERNRLPYAESCARQIWYGHADAFDAFPRDQIAGGSLSLDYGAEGYRKLLRLNLGLLSHKVGETNITGQLRKAWEQLRDTDPEASKPYETLVQHLTSDTRLIRHKILSDWKMKDSELCARDLSDMQKGDSVLIIGHCNAAGNVSSTTDNIARKVSSNPNRAASEIAITHPDPAIAENLFKGMQMLCKEGRVPSPITSADFADVPLAFELYDRVYITLPMESYPEADSFIIRSWKERVERGNSLTHLRAKPEQGAVTSKEWTDATLDSFVSPDDIRAEMIRRGRNNDFLKKRAEIAINHCIESRLNGIQPSAKTLDGYTPPPAPNCG